MHYVPFRQRSQLESVRLAIRSGGEVEALRGQLLNLARAVDPAIRLTNIVPFREIVNRTLVTERLVAQVSTAFAVFGVLIACVGLYGVLAYAAVRRRREIGVRIAVGASPGRVEWMMLRESLGLLVIGFLIGLPSAIGVIRFGSSLLYGLQPWDPITIALTLAILTMSSMAAAYLPARLAAGIDPIQALRED
jgi:ABC-type antimicrobial peptide transport system permease subunit